MNKRNNQFLLISGMPGVGKTLAIKSTMESIELKKLIRI